MKFTCALLVVLFLITGCMNFYHVDIPKVENKEPKSKPVIAVEVGNFIQCYDEEIGSRNVVVNEEMRYNCASGLLKLWQKHKLIKGFYLHDKLNENRIKAFQPAEKYKNGPDYTLIISGFINENSSLTLDITSPLTLFIIPSYTAIEFDLSFILINNKSKKEVKEKFKTSFTVWKNIVFLPVFPLFWIKMDERINERSMLLYHKFYEKGAFEH